MSARIKQEKDLQTLPIRPKLVKSNLSKIQKRISKGNSSNRDFLLLFWSDGWPVKINDFLSSGNLLSMLEVSHHKLNKAVPTIFANLFCGFGPSGFKLFKEREFCSEYTSSESPFSRRFSRDTIALENTFFMGFIWGCSTIHEAGKWKFFGKLKTGRIEKEECQFFFLTIYFRILCLFG